MRVLIADDEPLARRALVQLLVRHPDVEVAAECEDGAEARQILSGAAIDLAFLDIRMPEVTGLEAAAFVRDGRPLIVFVTAHEEFGVPAFERGALDYLLKPVTQARVDAALARVRSRLAAEEDASRYRALVGGSAPRYLDRLRARIGEREVLIPVDAIEVIVADDVYAAVYAGGRRYLLRTPLDDLERRLSPKRFLRVHRSYIVPVDAVVATRRREGRVVLELRSGATVPVSRRRRRELDRLTAGSAPHRRGATAHNE